MCGELEEEAGLETETCQRFVAHVQSVLAQLQAKRPKNADQMHTYLDTLFRDLLRGTIDESKTSESIDAFQRLAMEPLVFARVAGFMAAHMPLHDDPLRRVIEALMTGYAEGEIALPDHDHHHDHDHGHSHGHAH